MDLVAVVREDDVDEVLPDVVDVALHRRQHDGAAPAGLVLLHVRFEVRDGGLHRLGRLQYERQLHLTGGKEVADGLHPRQKEVVHDLEGAVPGERLVEVTFQPDPVPVDDALGQAPVDRPAAAVFGDGRGRGGAGEGFHQCGERVVVVAPPVVDEVETDLPVGGVDLVQRRDPSGVDDRGVETCGDALVEEHGVQHLAGRGARPNETFEIPSTVCTPGSSRLIALIASIVSMPSRRLSVHARRQRQRQGVEEEVLRFKPVAPDGEVVDRPGGVELPRRGAGLALLVDAGANDRGAVLRGESQERVEPRARPVAVLEVHRVDDAAPAEEFERGARDGGLGRVDDDRGRRLRREPTHHLAHVGDAVGAGVVDADVDQVRAFAHLIAGHRGRGVEVAGQHGLTETLRAVRVRPLADDEEGELLFEGHEAVERGRARLVLDGAARGDEPRTAFHDSV